MVIENPVNFRLAAAIGWALLAAAGSWAEMELHAEAGVGDRVRSGAVVPVRVQLTNHSEEDYRGRVGVAFESSLVPGSGTWAYRNLPMPPGAKKSAYLYLPSLGAAGRVLVRYENGRGQVVEAFEGQVQLFPRDAPVLLGVDVPPSGLPDTKVDGQDIYYRVSMTAEKLPPDLEGLLMFDAIVLSPPPYTPLRTNQTIALRDWVLRGGILIVDCSRRTDFFREGMFADLLPYRPTASRQGQPAIFDRELLYTVGNIRGGEILLEADDTPLVVRRRLGLGSVTCFAVDPDSPAFKNYSGRESLWDTILQNMRLPEKVSRLDMGDPSQYNQQVRASVIEAVDTGPRTSVRLGIVVLLTALYALAVGPGDYLLVKKLRRPKLTWITFPLIVIAFTAAAYYGARAYVGGQLSVTSRERVVVFPDDNLAIEFDLASVFAPAGARYAIATNEDGMLLPMTPTHQLSDTDTRIFIDDGRVEQYIPVWTRRAYRRSTTLSPGPGIAFELYAEGDDVFARIRNLTDYTLEQNHVAYKSRIFSLPQLRVKPDETVETRVCAVSDLEGSDMVEWRRDQQGSTNRFTKHLAILYERAPDPLIDMRELDLRLALDQGAAVFVSGDAGMAPSSLSVNSNLRPESGRRTVQVVTYEGAAL